jgi:hypothetical protein
VTLAPSQTLKQVTNTFTVSFWANPQSAHKVDQESTGGTSGTVGQKYAIGPQQGATAHSANHAGMGVSVGTNGVSVYEHSAGYLPAADNSGGQAAGEREAAARARESARQ